MVFLQNVFLNVQRSAEKQYFVRKSKLIASLYQFFPKIDGLARLLPHLDFFPFLNLDYKMFTCPCLIVREGDIVLSSPIDIYIEFMSYETV